MGSLSKLWLEVEKVKSQEREEETPCLSIEYSQILIEKTVILLECVKVNSVFQKFEFTEYMELQVCITL